MEPKRMFQQFSHFITVVLEVLTEAKSLFFFSTKPVPAGIIVLIALSVLSLALQGRLVHRQEIHFVSLDFNTLSIRKT